MLEKKIADKEKSGVHIGSILRKYQAFQGAALYDRERSGLPTHCHTLQDISGAWGYPLPAFLKRLRKKKKRYTVTKGGDRKQVVRHAKTGEMEFVYG